MPNVMTISQKFESFMRKKWMLIDVSSQEKEQILWIQTSSFRIDPIISTILSFNHLK